jgi:hypothetical protein
MDRFREVLIPISELMKAPMGCAWRGCTESFPMGKMPAGWRNLLVYYAREPTLVLDFRDPEHMPRMDRDACLCPAHAIALDQFLKVIR